MVNPRPWLTVPEAATHVQRTPSAIYQWIQRGKIHPEHTTDYGVLINTAELENVDRTTPRRGGRPRTKEAT